MAEQAPITRTSPNGSKLMKVSVAWESHTDGTKANVAIGRIDGRIVQFVTDPDGTNAPAADYDITLLDEDLVDVSGGSLTDLSATVTEVNRPTDGTNLIDRWTMGNHTLTFANLGAGTEAGVINIFWIAE